MTANTLRDIPLADLKPADDNVRVDVGDITELAESIRSLGVLEPLIVTPNGSGYLIVAGARRHAAAQLAGVETVPCLVREFDDRTRVEAMLVENLQREDLDPLEEAAALQRLHRDYGVSQRDLSSRIGRSQSHISKRIKLLDLPAAAQKAIRTGDLGVETAGELVKLADDPKRIERIVKDRRFDRWSIESEIREAANDRKAAKKRAELAAQGVRVVDYDRFRSKRTAKRIGADYHAELKISEKKHANEPCHAVTVGTGWEAGKVIPLCTEPKRHEPKGASALKIPVEKRARAVRATVDPGEAARKEAKKARGIFMAGLLDGPRPPDGLEQLTALALIDSMWNDYRKRAATILGEDPKDAADALKKRARKSTADAQRVTAALTFAQLEGNTYGLGMLGDLIRWMRARGYVAVGSDKRIKEPKK